MGYLKFNQLISTGKTKVFKVDNTFGDNLGLIKWQCGWRRYVFHPHNALFDSKCLCEVVEFLDRLMKEREDGRKTNKIQKGI